MEQKSNVQYRAEKEYKNSREKFFLLLREIISNSIHAVLIRQKKSNSFIPDVKLDIKTDESQCIIELTDNGEGFNENNSHCFNELDKINLEKESYKFHPLGQGRLAIVYFSDSAEYETVYKNSEGKHKKKTFKYPDTNTDLYSLDLFPEDEVQNTDTYTKLTIKINKQASFSRAKTFFSKYSDFDKLKEWFVENFFPFIVSNEKLAINLAYNGKSPITINKNSLESSAKPKPFDVTLNNKKYQFKLWLIKKAVPMAGENPIICFARNLRAELSNGKLSYFIDNEDGYLLYLTSDYFDECVDTKGEKIEISTDAISQIDQKITQILDDEFKDVIANNQKKTGCNFKSFRKKYPSLETFVDQSEIVSNKSIIKEADIVKKAIDEKSRIEKKFWAKIDSKQEEDGYSFADSDECQKLLNSSLHIYVKHREQVLKTLHNLIQRLGEDGKDKSELESKVHELFFKRGTTLKESSNINHLHNLWIIDDKYTIFSNDFKAQSTKNGQSASDIYIWADNPEKTKEVLIVELKSTTKAHNAGSRDESMIAQVKRYAQDFYKDSTKFLNWRVDASNVLFGSYIIANRDDIRKELNSIYTGGDYRKLPFLDNSYYLNGSFKKPGSDDPMDTVPIRIELYSFEDIYELASSRNEVFFKLLKNEFGTDETEGD